MACYCSFGAKRWFNIYSPRTNIQISHPFRRMPVQLSGSCVDWRMQNISGLPPKATRQKKEKDPLMCDVQHLHLWNEILLRLITHSKYVLAGSQTQDEWRRTWCGCGKCSQFPMHLVKTELFLFVPCCRTLIWHLWYFILPTFSSSARSGTLIL